MPTRERTVPDDAPEGLRIDVFALEAFPEIASRAQARKLVRRGALTVDGRPASPTDRLRPGQRLRVDLPDAPPEPALALPLDVVYEDDWMAVVDKPAGLPTSGNHRRTLVRALPANLRPSPEPDALARPHPVHRLDARTGGLVVVAKTARAQVALGRAFEERRVRKRYRAILLGRLEGSGELETPLDGRRAVTRWRAALHTPSWAWGWLTTVDAWPVTGRKHQLRRHFAILGHPVLGDGRYAGPAGNLRHKGLYLRAVELRLDHPVTGGPLVVAIPEPPRFARRREREAAHAARRARATGPGREREE